MVSGVVIRVAAGGGFAGNPPGALAVCVTAVERDGQPAGLFVFENGEGRALTWADFHAAGAVVGFADWLCGKLTAEAVDGLSSATRREVFRSTFALDWPISPRRAAV